MGMNGDLIHINEQESEVLGGFGASASAFEGMAAMAPKRIPTVKNDRGYFNAEDHRQIKRHLANPMSPDGMSAGPMGTTGMHYVDRDGKLSTGMRGEKTPAHLSKNQDTAESFVASEMARNSLEQLRSSLPREVQDNLRGDMFIERANDGMYSLLVGDDDTGYVEMSYGPENYQDALQDVKRALNYTAHTGDAKMDAGFMGRASSAYRYNGYSKPQLSQIAQDRLNELQNDIDNTPTKIAAALSEVDALNDEESRLDNLDRTRELSYSRRALDREAKLRASKMMEQGRQ
jgi:hypothetical protein